MGVTMNESILLVSETGCGKTTLVQHLAKLRGKKLYVINMNIGS
jgi:midasin